MKSKNFIYSCSGGKDSTAMVLMAVERKEPIEAIIFFDTGWEFPQIIKHIDLLEKKIGIKIWRLHSRIPFEYWLLHQPVKQTKKGLEKLTGEKLTKRWNQTKNININILPDIMPTNRSEIIEKLTGKIIRFGGGWPSPIRRWCTRIKVDGLDYFASRYRNPMHCIGFTKEEQNRVKENSKFPKRYPLIEWGITEKDALQYCYDKGFHWDGAYEIFNRVSCYCCPLTRTGELYRLRKHFPELWAEMLNLDSQIFPNIGFHGDQTVSDMEEKFSIEENSVFFKEFLYLKKE